MRLETKAKNVSETARAFLVNLEENGSLAVPVVFVVGVWVSGWGRFLHGAEGLLLHSSSMLDPIANDTASLQIGGKEGQEEKSNPFSLYNSQQTGSAKCKSFRFDEVVAFRAPPDSLRPLTVIHALFEARRRTTKFKITDDDDDDSLHVLCMYSRRSALTVHDDVVEMIFLILFHDAMMTRTRHDTRRPILLRSLRFAMPVDAFSSP